MKTTEGADFVLAIADLNQVILEKDGARIIAVCMYDRFKGSENIELHGKVMWYWPEATVEQYAVHSVVWLYRTDGIHRGPGSHVSLHNGTYLLFDHFEDGEPMAYMAAREHFERRV